MDRYLLRYFLAVAELGSFSKAAARVERDPAHALGRASPSWRAELGARLFERTTRRVSLTPAGSRFLQHARRITQEYEVALREVSDAPQLKRVRAGVLSTISCRATSSASSRARARMARGEALEILDSTERDIANRLTDGRLDVALTILRPGLESFAQEKLRNEPYVLFVAAQPQTVGGRRASRAASSRARP